jgi:tetratricopeptide (TPR) repeat protein
MIFFERAIPVLTNARVHSSLLCVTVSSLIVLSCFMVKATRADDAALCDDEKAGLAARLAACTRIIDQTKVRATRSAASAANYNAVEATYITRAWLYRAQGRVDLAIRDYTLGIALRDRFAPSDPMVRFFYDLRGDAYHVKGDFPRALADYNRLLQTNPKAADVLVERALVYRDMGDFDRAFADLDRAIELQPTSFNYSMRGVVWRYKGDLDRALVDQDKAVAIGTKNEQAIVRLDRGDTLRYKGQFAHALDDYNEALRIVPNFVAALAWRGLTLERMGQPERARADFERAVEEGAKVTVLEEPNDEAYKTAQARLAALDSGAAAPVIPAAPGKVTSPTSIPTKTVALPAAVTTPATTQGRRVALVIGNSAYANVNALPNPKRDSQAVAAALRNIGFDSVTLVSDASHEQLVNALRSFANEAEAADWAVVYYAGHGIEVGGMNYLIPVDAKLAVDRDVQFEAVPLDQVMAAVDGAKKLKIALLDACRDNPFVPHMRRTAAPEASARSASTAGAAIASRSVGRGLGEVHVTGATLVVYAAKHGQVALDGEGGNSPFAAAFLQRVATPGVEINKVFRLVRDDVMEMTAGRQEPYTYGSLPGREDFFFVPAK